MKPKNKSVIFKGKENENTQLSFKGHGEPKKGKEVDKNMKTRKRNKKGISLIVLVITIIVMIILAAAVILSLSSNGIIDRANEAVDKTDKAQVQNLASLIWADAYLDGNKSSGNLRAEVVKGLKNSGITEQDYVVFATANGVDVVPTDSWEYICTYSEAAGWSSKLTKEDEIEDKNPTITAKFYKTGNKITLTDEALGDIAGIIEPEQDEYKMVISGTGNMGTVVVETEDEMNLYAWQEDLLNLLLGEQVVPIIFCTTEAIIEQGIENIPTGCFLYGISLKNITIPNSVTSIGMGAFSLCDNLTNIHVSSKEQWNSMLISDGNDSVVDATITYDYRTNVEMLANEGWQKAYNSGKKAQSALETAVYEYLEANEISSEKLALYNIDVTTKGVNITAKSVTLSDTILSALDYGKTVNYSANGINNWKVLYKQTVDEEEYVYLIASEKISGEKIPKNIPGSKISGDNIYWESGKAPSVVASGTINSTRWLANWSDYGANANVICISYFLDENYWTAFKNTSKYGDNVVGAIGTPTLEMFAASYNKRSEALGDTSAIELIDGRYGYKIGESYTFHFSRIDSLYWWSSKDGTDVWLASPSDGGFTDLFYVGGGGEVNFRSYITTTYGLRPVVCLKSSIQACVGLSADGADIILK